MSRLSGSFGGDGSDDDDEDEEAYVRTPNLQGGPTDDRVAAVREALYNSVVAWLSSSSSSSSSEGTRVGDGGSSASGWEVVFASPGRPLFGWRGGGKDGGRRLAWGGRDDYDDSDSDEREGNVGVAMAVYEGDGDGEVTLGIRRRRRRRTGGGNVERKQGERL